MTTGNQLEALQANAGQASALLKALSNEKRLLLLCFLIDKKEMTSGELAQSVGLSPSASSQHLAKMREEGLISVRREAQTIHYRISDPKVKHVIALLKKLYCP